MNLIEIIYTKLKSGASVSTDTRSITNGCVFFALKGDRFDGNKFAFQALSLGASLAVVDDPDLPADKNLIRVNNVLLTLQEVARHHRKTLHIPIIAVTGSNGKTTTKELLSRVLASKYKVLSTKGNLNNHIGVPLTLLALNESHEIAVIEMGANHRHEISLLCSIALPTHVLITNVGKAHLEGFGGFEGVKKGKGEMYGFAKENEAVVLINDDDAHLKEMLGKYDRTIRYGLSDDCFIQWKMSESENNYASFSWRSTAEASWKVIHSNMTGVYNVPNMLSAITIGKLFGVNDEAIQQAIESYHPDNQRSQEINIGNLHIILDAYNANPTSMEAALLNFKKVASESYKKVVLLGEMLELGEATEMEHRNILIKLAEINPDLCILVGQNFKAVSDAAPKGSVFFENSTQAANYLQSCNLSAAFILIKGSRGSKMELVLEGLKH